MKAGGGKAKGAAFERLVCKQLSLWVTEGQREDVFWRSAMSGGRATVGLRAGKDMRRQAGDICAVSPEGHALMDHYYIECKHLKSIGLDSLVKGTGTLITIWRSVKREAHKHGRRVPLLIACQNRWPVLVCSTIRGSMFFPDVVITSPKLDISIYRFDKLLQSPCPFKSEDHG